MSDIKSRDRELIFMGRILEDHFGKEALNKLVDFKQKQTKKEWREKSKNLDREDPAYLLNLFTDKVHDYEIIQNNSQCLEVKVYSCKHAQIFQSFNAEDLGEKLICEGDHAVVAGYNPELELKRKETCMSGDSCHFIFKFKDK